MVRVPSLALLALGFAFAGCSHAQIPGTSLEDNEDNRAILAIIDAYHAAIENRDSEALLALVSEDYYEDVGNTDRNDDYGKGQLKESLELEFSKTERIQLSLRIEDIEYEGETRAFAFVLYTIRARSEFPSGKKWKSSSDRARFELERPNKEGKWLITGGL